MVQPSASDLARMRATPLVDPFGRAISYLRVSVTDRCDLRCTYCMDETMSFLPRQDLLTLEELDRLCSAFILRGTRKLRITGGEPLVRRDILGLFGSLSRHLASGALHELTLTTNGTQLARYAAALADVGVRRINVSLDTLDPATFMRLTRRDGFAAVMRGLDAAQQAGLQVKINTVALKGTNEDEAEALVRWAHGRRMDITFIEVMPLGEDFGRKPDSFVSLKALRSRLAEAFTLEPLAVRTGGPARYDRAIETGGRIGFITPMSHNFCESCNRVRLTCTGTLYLCLGQTDAADLRAPLRSSADDAALHAAIGDAIARKPRGHDFVADRAVARARVGRTMSLTGG